MQSSVSISRTDEAIYLRFNEMALFKSGFADILPESEKTLNNIMFIIKEYVDYMRQSELRVTQITCLSTPHSFRITGILHQRATKY
jgi:hypothetical protein